MFWLYGTIFGLSCASSVTTPTLSCLRGPQSPLDRRLPSSEVCTLPRFEDGATRRAPVYPLGGAPTLTVRHLSTDKQGMPTSQARGWLLYASS